jgi:hypothetical protein
MSVDLLGLPKLAKITHSQSRCIEDAHPVVLALPAFAFRRELFEARAGNRSARATAIAYFRSLPLNAFIIVGRVVNLIGTRRSAASLRSASSMTDLHFLVCTPGLLLRSPKDRNRQTERSASCMETKEFCGAAWPSKELKGKERNS